MENKVLRVLGCGSRGFKEYDYVCNEQGVMEQMLTYLDKNIYTKLLEYEDYDIEIIEGHARGADAYFQGFAKRHELNLRSFPAEWDKYGKSAGYKRNAEMINYIKQADARFVVCLWDGVSKGTKNTIDLCIRDNIPVYVYIYTERRWAHYTDGVMEYIESM